MFVHTWIQFLSIIYLLYVLIDDKNVVKITKVSLRNTDNDAVHNQYVIIS